MLQYNMDGGGGDDDGNGSSGGFLEVLFLKFTVIAVRLWHVIRCVSSLS